MVWFEDENRTGGCLVNEGVRKKVMEEWDKLNLIEKQLNTLEGVL